ncbi:hypothetical protein Bhyg_14704 [Pseudolycoriella hygida]|uniref:Uncharacterized protein n=1 Tax=Pseudolycoriella hygida TaxID=35572 RepID=A0A9Q0RXF6_9DIPT|nr:hypothetical protein Bhyg_14704 [Pseudolycoriella hygida]
MVVVLEVITTTNVVAAEASIEIGIITTAIITATTMDINVATTVFVETMIVEAL